ncbi:MAG: HD domain-containing protein [Planctomycetes bacterium]|nr:HD domain-containing protein [Planctomycetota bacterium]
MAMTVAVVFGCTDEVVLTAALLHDTIEDTTTDFDDLENEVGVQVAEIVAALTKNMAMPNEQRESEYAARLVKADWRARLIKLADQFDNVSDAIASGWTGEKMKKVVGKAEKAIEWATGDEAAHAATARAMRVLEKLIEDAKSRG